MTGRVASFAFLGLPGLREIILVALVALAMYGRSGLLLHRRVRALRPWPSPVRSSKPVRDSSPRSDRVFWFLAIVTAAAVAAWIVTRMTIGPASGPPH